MLQISFVIPQESVPGRMGLLITLLLVLVNLFISVSDNSPDTHALTYISTWVLACIIFVQAAMLEYGCILLLKHVRYNQVPDLGQKILHTIDSFCLLISINAFAIFNYIYWIYLVPKGI